MSQKTRPSADILTGSWSNTPLYPKLYGAAAGGSSVKSGAGTPGDTMEVSLAEVAQACCAEATLSVALRKNEAGSLPTSIALLQGDMVIGGHEVQPSQSFGNADLSLSLEQICKITDPTGLSVRITAGRPTIGCCANIPALLTATIHNVVDCEVLEGVTVPICWNGTKWRGEVTVCDMPLWIDLFCTGSGPSGFSLIGHWGSDDCTAAFAGVPGSPFTCDPFFLHFLSSTTVSETCPCCTFTAPTFDIDVTA